MKQLKKKTSEFLMLMSKVGCTQGKILDELTIQS